MRERQAAGPFVQLGQELRALRTRAKESLSDTSEAIEIESKQLLRFELGQVKPNEETLLMLISHFKPLDNEALRIWELAEYTDKDETLAIGIDEDDPALFTDFAEVNGSIGGVVIDFKQSAGASRAPKSVSRVGMSREQAENLARTLAIVLAKTSPASVKKLPPGQSSLDNL